MQHKTLYKQLSAYYLRMDPHHETWILWNKPDKSIEEIFEVAIGTILVQNTNWRNVDNAVVNLKKKKIYSFAQVRDIKLEELEQLILPAGFYKQKANYLKALSEIFLKSVESNKTPSREELLKTKGIGKETADSILNFCFNEPVPVIGTYTRRFFARIFGKEEYLKKKRYEDIQIEIYDNLKPEAQLFGKFHALIVCHCQNFCHKKKPDCKQCPLLSQCSYGQKHETDPKMALIQSAIAPTSKKIEGSRDNFHNLT